MEQSVLEQLVAQCQPLTSQGKVASYIPELERADSSMLGVCIADVDGTLTHGGDSQVPFTIQSISKLFVFTCCLLDSGMERVLQTVSLEPTAESFNSIVNLEVKNLNKPLNPMINAGAIASLTLVGGDTPHEKFERVLSFVRHISGNPDIGINESVYLSEKRTGSRNRALAYYMNSTGVIDCDVEAILDAYFRICSIEMNCIDLAKTAMVYAKNGAGLFDSGVARTVKAVTALCGMYDESGRVAVEVSVPSKSGVGGGIWSCAPGKMGIGIFSPALNEKGTSMAGLELLKCLSRQMNLSIY